MGNTNQNSDFEDKTDINVDINNPNSVIADTNTINKDNDKKSSTIKEDIQTNNLDNPITLDADTKNTKNNSSVENKDKITKNNPKNTIISLETNSIYVGDPIIIYLKDTKGTPIINGNLSILINNNNYDRTTDSNGAVTLKIDLPANNYLLNVKYPGNETYKSLNSIFTLSINKKQSNIMVHTYYVVKGKDLIVQLIDNTGVPIKQKFLSVSIFNTVYTLQTDDNGFVYLNINPNTGNYLVNIKYDGDEFYTSCENIFNLNVYQLQTKFVIPTKWVVRTTHFVAYLKDSNGNPVIGAIVKLTFKKKKYLRVTDSNGRIRLKINKLGKYKIKLIYNGANSYIKTSKSLVIKSYRAKTKIVAERFTILKGNSLVLYLKDKYNRVVPHKKLIITWHKKKYKRVTNADGKIFLKLTKRGTYKLKISFLGTKGYIKKTRTIRVSVINNYDLIDRNALKLYLNGNENTLYNMRIVGSNGNPLIWENVTLKVKCNNFTSGTGRRITKKTIVLNSDNIFSKSKDKRLLKNMAKLLRAKGYKVIISGIGPNYHVKDVKKYSNVCLFTLVGGIDSGMFVDMASSYYKKLLRKHKNQVVLGCVRTPKGINLADRIWLNRAHDDDYSDASFYGLTFPGQYLNKKANIDYVYGPSASRLVNNFLKYARHGKSIGLYNTIPGTFTNFERVTDENGYISLELPFGTHTIIASYFDNFKNSWVDATEYVKVMK